MFAFAMLHPLTIASLPAPHVHTDDVGTAAVIALCAVALVVGDWLLNRDKVRK